MYVFSPELQDKDSYEEIWVEWEIGGGEEMGKIVPKKRKITCKDPEKGKSLTHSQSRKGKKERGARPGSCRASYAKARSLTF